MDDIKTITGIMIMGDLQRQVNDAQTRTGQFAEQNTMLSMTNSNLQGEINRLKEQNRIYKETNIELLGEISRLKQQLETEKAAHEATTDKLADWMVSQKAFKDLSIQLGAERGMSKEAVVSRGLEMEMDVLENKHDPAHKTNVGNSVIMGLRAEKLKAELRKKAQG